MELPRLVILYGGINNLINEKQQRMIDSKCTCGYREYAKKFGHIAYLTPQACSQFWESSYTNPKDIINFINSVPGTIVWSVKHNSAKDEQILKHIKNKKIYYSCCNKNMYNDYCDINLVDHISRNNGSKCRLHLKGKDPEYWKPTQEPEYDYLLIGKRADKNELYFLERLSAEVNEKRHILWIGGEEHQKLAHHKVGKHHNIYCTPFFGPEEVRNHISKAKVGVLFTEHPSEGFPQSFLEMTMCGVPVVYPLHAPGVPDYFGESINCMLVGKKKQLIDKAEYLLKNHSREKCRVYAIKHYSLQKSYERMVSYVS